MILRGLRRRASAQRAHGQEGANRPENQRLDANHSKPRSMVLPRPHRLDGNHRNKNDDRTRKRNALQKRQQQRNHPHGQAAIKRRNEVERSRARPGGDHHEGSAKCEKSRPQPELNRACVAQSHSAPPQQAPCPAIFPAKHGKNPQTKSAADTLSLRVDRISCARPSHSCAETPPKRGPKGQAPKPAEARPKGPSPQNPPRRGPKGQARPGLDPPKPQPGQEARESTTQARPMGPSGRPSPGDSNVTSEARSSGGAGNRTRVREASRSPSFTCVVAVSPATGFPDSAETYLSLFLDHAIESTLARSSPVVTPYGYQDDLSGRRLSGS